MHAGTFECSGYSVRMRGGLQRWKRGVSSQGVRQAVAYAFGGSCDSHLRSTGGSALEHYSGVEEGTVSRFTATADGIAADTLNAQELSQWVDGNDPATGERRGRELNRPDADLVLDGTINAPKSYSLAALLNSELAAEFEALQDRLRQRIISTWQQELNARRGAGGSTREGIAQLEVVELQHRRSRSLDPHVHRHLWLNVRVQGEDGRWSNLDSRVAMKLHTVVNAEGEVAARTDPQWVAALARNGFTLDGNGEIAELAHLVRPVSRRSNQIEANRALKLAEWREAHPGEEPSPDALLAIDRWAWAHNRPNKPGDVDEGQWEELVISELRNIDPQVTTSRRPAEVARVQIADLDRDLLAARAVVDADKRSSPTGGRYSRFDLRAGALRALAASGVVEHRELLEEVIEDLVARALQMSVDVLGDEQDVPGHIKALLSTTTATLKLEVAEAFERLNGRGKSLSDVSVEVFADRVLDEGKSLGDAQREAAAAIAGTHRTVTVTGPAGTGKTTLLRVARAALDAQQRRMVVVAPTKKAATVVGREVGADASSVHALLLDHGWRWSTDSSGAEVWRHLEVGEVDGDSGRVYDGPRRYPLGEGDRIVVDEAGMVDLRVALALAEVAERTGAGIAMVGDHLQARPVGHSGAMATLKQRSGAVVELTAVHRFSDPEYAELSLRIREPESPADAHAVGLELLKRGLVQTVSTEQDARDRMVDAYMAGVRSGERIALVTSTNEEAQRINEVIQGRLLESGRLSAHRIAVGQNEQRLLEGDIVQTRRNDAAAGVENRALWRVSKITRDGARLVSLNDSADVREVSAEYLADHVHLSYASTVHGVQGETTERSFVGPGVDASGLYVGMTRGRHRNVAIVVAPDDADAVEQLAEAMVRGRQEVDLGDARVAAQRELDRAARRGPSEDSSEGAAWSDRARRPLGTIIDLDQFLGGAAEERDQLREQLERVNDAIHRDNAALRQVRVRLATSDAVGWAKHVSGADLPETDSLERVHAQLSQRVEDRVQERADLARAHAVAAQRVDQVTFERAVREALLPSEFAAEDAARVKHANDVRATRRPGGPVAGTTLGL